MITVIPAIDLIDGKCVRLTQGDYNQKTTYTSDTLEIALNYENYGFKRLHLVDLDGAKAGDLKNLKTLEKIANKTSLEIDFGGGIKNLTSAKNAINSGASLINIGSLAVKDPSKFQEIIVAVGPEKIILATDVKDEKLAINGWQENTNIDLLNFLETNFKLGIKNILCTDIAKDGMLGGANNLLYKKIIEKYTNCYLIASGGISSLTDIQELDRLNIPAVVVGKAIYENKISLDELSNYILK